MSLPYFKANLVLTRPQFYFGSIYQDLKFPIKVGWSLCQMADNVHCHLKQINIMESEFLFCVQLIEYRDVMVM